MNTLQGAFANGAQVRLTLDQLVTLLDLPEGTIVTRLCEDSDWTTEGFRMFLYHPKLPKASPEGFVEELKPVIIAAEGCGHHLLAFAPPGGEGT